MSRRVEFSGGIRGMILYSISITVLVGTILFVSQTKLLTTLIVLAIVNILYWANMLRKPIKLIVSHDRSVIEIHYLLKLLREAKVVPLHEAEWTYAPEVRARGGKVHVLRIRNNGESLVELLPNHDGWRADTLLELFKKLNETKKFNGSPPNKTEAT
jgi:hypothetical protein